MAIAVAGGLYGCNGDHNDDQADNSGDTTTPPVVSQEELVNKAVADVQNVVVIFAENRSFDNLYSEFPGQLDPLSGATYEKQKDRDGTVLATLPQVWGGLTTAASTQFVAGLPTVTQADTDGMANAPFSINEEYSVGLNAVTHDLWHQFYQNQMQINGGKNDMFAAWADSGGMVMGHFSGTEEKTLPLWAVAQKYTLADRFFQGAFGGSFLNHQYLIASAPLKVDATLARFTPQVAQLTDGDQGHNLALATGHESDSALTNAASAVLATPYAALTPDGYAVNTMQPPYQPSGVAPLAGATGDDLLLANNTVNNVPTPQTGPNIGDYLTTAGIDWAWYAGGYGYIQGRTLPPAAYAGNDGNGLNAATGTPNVNYQFHHQPFNYFTRFDPTTDAGQAERAKHLKDGGLEASQFMADIDSGKLPAVTFYKPEGNLNEHSGYADVLRGDQNIANIISHLEKSPQWGHMLVVVTYDENGGIWDHVAPPKGDRFGPGSRIPALVIGPNVKKGFVDHTYNDTTSILRFITRRWSLPVLPGLKTRNDGYASNGVTIGDLSETLITDTTATATASN
ncbi:acid phosphatase [Bordetella ansorpii]